MKTKQLLFFGMPLFVSLHYFGQSLTQSTHAPKLGDTYTTIDCSTVVPVFGTGAGQNFNFSTLSVNSTSITYNGVTATSTGSTASYPSANIAVQSGTNNAFYNESSTVLKYYGGNISVGGLSAVLIYSSPAIYGKYPMSLGTTTTSITSGTILAFSNNGLFNGTCTANADATGTLTLPGSITYTNAIRVYLNQVMTFTIAGSITGSLMVEQYDYYAPSYSFWPNTNNNWPVISVQSSTLSTAIGGTSTQTFVTINSQYQFLSVPKKNNTGANIIVFPNPAINKLTINANTKYNSAATTITDLSGKIIKQNSFEKNALIELNTEEIPAGIYILDINIDNKQYNQKISIQH